MTNSPYYNAGVASGRKAAVENKPIAPFRDMHFAGTSTANNHEQFKEGFHAGYMLEKLGISPNKLFSVQYKTAHVATLCQHCWSDDEIMNFLKLHNHIPALVPKSAFTVVEVYPRSKAACNKCGFRINAPI